MSIHEIEEALAFILRGMVRLDERRGDWLFHDTDIESLAKIIRSKKLRGRYYTSFSTFFVWGGHSVVLVFDKAKLGRRVMEVEYTDKWARAHPEHANHIGASPDIPDEDDEDDARDTRGVDTGAETEIGQYSDEREFITVKPGPIGLDALDRILIHPRVSQKAFDSIRKAAPHIGLSPEDVMRRGMVGPRKAEQRMAAGRDRLRRVRDKKRRGG